MKAVFILIASIFLLVTTTSTTSAFVPRKQSIFPEKKSVTNEMLADAACVGVGAVTGAVCRWQIGNVVTRKLQEYPRLSYFQGWHTAGINILGSFVLGTLAGLPTVDQAAMLDKRGITARARLMAGVGFCGSFTTFSTYAVDIVGWLNKGEVIRAFSYMALNNGGGVMAAFAGFHMAKRFLRN
mmetsp:Transcript_35550/g.74944  ORF Transcript_35550/g.74944 Transcript_35550/m.74944 type:complete len:183 (-) Transcript_35550:347-895(-)